MAEPYQQPTYSAVTVFDRDMIPCCDFCSALVKSTQDHDAWHAQLYAVLSRPSSAPRPDTGDDQ